MKTLVVFDHPRRNSFCGAVLDAFVQGLQVAGHVPEIADLYREGFDPRMPVDDEPDWGDQHKPYTSQVAHEQARLDRNDAIAFVFPVWWWSFPAMTKGWIDRVWNYGFAYGDRKLTQRKAILLAVNAGDAPQYRKRDYDQAMQTQIITGIVQYCGIADARLELMFEALGSAEIRQALLQRAGEIGRAL